MWLSLIAERASHCWFMLSLLLTTCTFLQRCFPYSKVVVISPHGQEFAFLFTEFHEVFPAHFFRLGRSIRMAILLSSVCIRCDLIFNLWPPIKHKKCTSSHHPYHWQKCLQLLYSILSPEEHHSIKSLPIGSNTRVFLSSLSTTRGRQKM